MAVSVRMASAQESDLVASLRIEFIEEGDGSALPLPLAEATRKWMRDLTALGQMQSWIAEDEEGTIGVVTVRIRGASPREDDLVGREAYVHNLYVRSKHRRGGVGRALMKALMDWCEEQGYNRVALRASAMGRPLYEQLGFVADRAMVYTAKD